MLKGTLTYSDQDGNVTAATIVNTLQEWILTSDGASITIDDPGSILKQNKFCPTGIHTLINNIACQAFPVDSHSSKQTIGYISVSFIGGVIIGLLISVLTMLIWFR